MNAGLVVQTLRRHRATLLGPVCTQVVAATVIAMMIDLHHSVTTSVSRAARGRTPLSDVMEAGDIFLHDAVYLSLVIVGITMSLGIGGQLRDIALLRSVGASPAQVRHSVVGQAAVTSVPAAVLGALLAAPCCMVWLQLLGSAGVVPSGVDFALDPVSFVAAAVVVLVTSVIGSYVAAIRTSRLAPAAALVEVGTTPRRERPWRTVAGSVLAVGGVVLAVLLSILAPKQLDDAGVFVMLAECLAAGLLSPVLLRGATRLAQRLVRHDLVRVAAVDLRTQARALGKALVPLVLAVAFAAVNVGMHATAAHVGRPDSVTSQWLDYSGTATFGAFATVAALTCFATVAVGRRRELATLQLAGASRATVLRVASIEAAIVAASTLLVAGTVALVALAPTVHAAYGVWLPHLPLVAVLVGVLGVVAVVGVGMLTPVARLTRTRPVRALAAAA